MAKEETQDAKDAGEAKQPIEGGQRQPIEGGQRQPIEGVDYKIEVVGDGLGGNIEWNPEDETRYLWYESEDARKQDEQNVSQLMRQLAQARQFRKWRGEANDEEQVLALVEEQRAVNRRTIEGTMQIARLPQGHHGGGMIRGGMSDEQRLHRQQRVQAQRQKHMLQSRRKHEHLALFKVSNGSNGSNESWH